MLINMSGGGGGLGEKFSGMAIGDIAKNQKVYGTPPTEWPVDYTYTASSARVATSDDGTFVLYNTGNVVNGFIKSGNAWVQKINAGVAYDVYGLDSSIDGLWVASKSTRNVAVWKKSGADMTSFNNSGISNANEFPLRLLNGKTDPAYVFRGSDIQMQFCWYNTNSSWSGNSFDIPSDGPLPTSINCLDMAQNNTLVVITPSKLLIYKPTTYNYTLVQTISLIGIITNVRCVAISKDAQWVAVGSSTDATAFFKLSSDSYKYDKNLVSTSLIAKDSLCFHNNDQMIIGRALLDLNNGMWGLTAKDALSKDYIQVSGGGDTIFATTGSSVDRYTVQKPYTYNVPKIRPYSTIPAGFGIPSKVVGIGFARHNISNMDMGEMETFFNK